MSRPQRRVRGEDRAGTEIVVDVGDVAHGGVCVARHEGRVVFVRHALPGERAWVRVTEGGSDDPFWRAEAIEIVTESPDRVQPPCPYAVPGGCGGCDWQHAAPRAQRRFKETVVAEQLRRLAGIDMRVEVEPVPGDADGLDWRTRVTYAVDADGRAGLHRHRSHDIVPIERCLIAHPRVRDVGVEAREWPDTESVEVVAASGGRLVIAECTSPEPEPPILASDVSVAVAADRDGSRLRALHGRTEVVEEAAGRRWQVTGGGFWQVHPGAADILAAAVLDALDPRPGERGLDLYCGVGLFTGVLAGRVGPDGWVVGVEGSRQAADDADWNLRDLPGVRVERGRVDRTLNRADVAPEVDVVVLDPPRTGAKARVVASIAARSPRAVAYVACDPAALARDVAIFAEHGYTLAGLRAFDLFPMTHHVECVAVLEPTAQR
ncbi:class I SAM-dependent RNA methyltransferase [Haloactinopolyspora alba]|uniref:class I SAM-dependent RNA methyltransferase n=1 Tax=Haloactinopolyspora alba TaxID=648780 RepID=UPI000D0D3D0D